MREAGLRRRTMHLPCDVEALAGALQHRLTTRELRRLSRLLAEATETPAPKHTRNGRVSSTKGAVLSVRQ